MCRDPEYVEQLQEDLKVFSSRANGGDDRAARAAADTAVELERLGVKPRVSLRVVDARIHAVGDNRPRMGFVKT